MHKIEPIYTAHAKATGGRDGTAKSDTGLLNVKLAPPKEMGGNGEGVNPEQLFAAGYAACFIGAMKFVGKRDGVEVPNDTSIDALVSIGKIEGGFAIAVELKIYLPGLNDGMADKVIAEAHKVCPYSNATHGNIEVKLLRV